jgi:hypothetical protein
MMHTLTARRHTRTSLMAMTADLPTSMHGFGFDLSMLTTTHVGATPHCLALNARPQCWAVGSAFQGGR